MIIPASPDPVREPKADQDMLAGLVGDDDPAQIHLAQAERALAAVLA